MWKERTKAVANALQPQGWPTVMCGIDHGGKAYCECFLVVLYCRESVSSVERNREDVIKVSM